jgi:predicted transcriptional regulator
MTVRVSTHKVSRIMRLYFKGLPQANIAVRAGVDQSTVSTYASRFKDRADEVGLLAAGKEFDVYNEVDGLRSLSVELAKADITVGEAKQGIKIIRAFTKLGVSPNRHAALVRVCKEVDNPRFVQAALKLAKLEAESKLTYEEAISRFENAIRELPQAEQRVKQARSELTSLNDHADRKKHEVNNLEAYMARLQNEANTRKVSLDQELAMKMDKAKVKEKEIEELATLKKELGKKTLDLQTLMRLAEEFPDEST